MAIASFSIVRDAGSARVRLEGEWTLSALPQPLSDFEAKLRDLSLTGAQWDLSPIVRLDSAGAVLLWRIWGRRLPQALDIARHQAVFERISAVSTVPVQGSAADRSHVRNMLNVLGYWVLAALRHLRDATALIGQLLLDIVHLMAHPQDIPWREFSATLYKSGAQALGVTALVGFLIGVVLSYLSSLQLKVFGADIFIVNLLGISVIRELGPVIVAVLVAGRSGSAMTAQIGVMRVTEEIDALATMGVSRTLRLVLPKVAALSLAMPLLVVWCSAAGLIGGMVSAGLEMGLSISFFIDTLPRVVPVSNLWIGMSKGFIFGFLIALIACHFGLRVRPNTESLSARTTSAVVTSITIVIIADAVFAVLTRSIGMPGA